MVLRRVSRSGKKIEKGYSFLDVGCGLGNHCFALLDYSPKEVYGFDISNETIELLKSFSDEIQFRKIDICEDDITEFKDRFDMAFSCDVYEHVNVPQVMLNNLYYILKKGGGVSVTFPNFDDHGHNQFYDINDFRKMIEKAGFRDIQIDIVRDRSFIYKVFTFIYMRLQDLSDIIFGIKRNPNRMPDSDEFHEMYAYKKINKIKNRKVLVKSINFVYNILKKVGRLSGVYSTEENNSDVKNKRIVFFAVK